MFYPLIPGFVAVLIGVSVPAAHQVAPIVPAVSAPITVEKAAPVMVEVVAPSVAKPAPVIAKPAQVIVIEVPSRLTFERLRRESSRYPEMGTAGRFIELSTECPPLFE